MAHESSPVVRCRDCALASFRRDTSGRLVRRAGRCLAQFPVVQAICLTNGKGEYPAKNAIWPDYAGVCDFYQVVDATKQMGSV